MTRLTRKEQQAETRRLLLEAAGRVFARHGLHGASVELVAAEAGFTKGAFYSNFSSKEELFLALLDERFAHRLAVLDELVQGSGSLAEQARAGGDEFQSSVRGEPEWERLFFEFTAHAARHEAFREQLVARWRLLVDRIAQVAELQLRAAGLEPQGDPRDFAQAVFAAGNGVALGQLLDPDEVREGLFGEVLELLTLGALAKAGALSAPAPVTGAPRGTPARRG